MPQLVCVDARDAGLRAAAFQHLTEPGVGQGAFDVRVQVDAAHGQADDLGAAHSSRRARA
jgi:hypothetical protein